MNIKQLAASTLAPFGATLVLASVAIGGWYWAFGVCVMVLAVLISLRVVRGEGGK